MVKYKHNKETLAAVQAWLERVECAEDMIRILQMELYKVKKFLTRYRGGGAVSYMDLLNIMIKEQTDTLKEITEAIDSVPDDVLRRLLYERYIKGHSWEYISEIIGYTPEWTRKRLHLKALDAAADFIPCNSDIKCEIIYHENTGKNIN